MQSSLRIERVYVQATSMTDVENEQPKQTKLGWGVWLIIDIIVGIGIAILISVFG